MFELVGRWDKLAHADLLDRRRGAAPKGCAFVKPLPRLEDAIGNVLSWHSQAVALAQLVF